jgi:hypothetical protein
MPPKQKIRQVQASGTCFLLFLDALALGILIGSLTIGSTAALCVGFYHAALGGKQSGRSLCVFVEFSARHQKVTRALLMAM